MTNNVYEETMMGKRAAQVTVAIMSAIVAGLLSSTIGASANGYAIIYSFQGGADGAKPVGSLITDKDGNLYGVTEEGGPKKGEGPGTVFEITPDGTKSILSYLGGGAGKDPLNGLLRDKHGNLYGTTSQGGDGGAVYELTSRRKKRVLWSFSCLPCFSWSNLIADQAGNLYGTTEEGLGAVFKLTSDGTFTTLYMFQGGNDGAGEESGLIMDGAGNLYGTNPRGGGSGCNGSGCGAVFKIAPDGAETVIYRFAGGTDGASPYGSLVEDNAGNLYGTTWYGGGSCTGPYGSCGIVFKVTSDGVESIVHAFKGGSDGSNPNAGLIIDKAGTLYGTTTLGGDGCGNGGCGTVFKVAPDGSESILYAFSGGRDGDWLLGGLLNAKDGYLYGTTFNGGGSGCGGSGCGTVFRIKR